MSDKNTRQIGRMLEEYILSKVKEIDPTARLTRGSGQGNEFSDISSHFCYVECKKRNTKDFNIKEEVWRHLNFGLPLNTTKFCMMAHENENKLRLITLDCETFFDILKKAKAWEVENGAGEL